MRLRKPKRRSIFLAVAVVSTVGYPSALAAGLHPDGAILGFAGTMWMIWIVAVDMDSRKAEQQKRDWDGV